MKRIIFVAVFLIFLPVDGFAQITREEAITEFVQGNLSYKEGDYARAIEKFESIVAQGKSSGNLYYNLANAYYRNGQLGKAIVNYERARRLMPRDGDVIFNHNYVLSKTNLFEGEIGRGFLERVVKSHINYYSNSEMMRIITFLILLMALIHILTLYRQWDKKRSRLALALVFILFFMFTSGLYLKASLQKSQAIIVEKSEAKFEPRPESTTHYKLRAGDKVIILREEDDWLKVERSDGKLGWILKEDAEKI